MDSKVFKKGEIYLANLNPKKGSEMGKLRPVLIYQSDSLNQALHPTSIILPLSTNIIEDTYPLRFFVNRRDRLKEDSQIVCDQIRAIDNRRIINDKIGSLDEKELLKLDMQMKIVFDFTF
jgi:mRNA interferase MazF